MAISMGAETEEVVRKFASKRGLEPREALEKLVATAVARFKALAKYAEKSAIEGGAPKAKAPKAKAPKAKAPKAKAPKAKAPKEADAPAAA